MCRLATSDASGVLREGADRVGLSLGVLKAIEELALQTGRQSSDSGGEGQGAGVGLREGDPEDRCHATLVCLVVEDACAEIFTDAWLDSSPSSISLHENSESRSRHENNAFGQVSPAGAT